MSSVGNLVVDGLPSAELLVQTPRALVRGSDLRGKALQGARLVGASALAAYAFRQRGWIGVGAIAASAWLVRSAMQVGPRRAQQRWTTVEAAVTIAGTPRQLYDAWRDPEAFARHLSNLTFEGEAPEGDDTFWFLARGADGRDVRWRARCAHAVPGSSIAWRTLDDAFPWSCDLSFRPAPGDRGTEVRVRMVFGPPAGDLGQIANGWHDDLDGSRAVVMDLRRFKQRMEAGELATIEGQSRGAPRPRPLPAYRAPLSEDNTPILELDEGSTPFADLPSLGGVR